MKNYKVTDIKMNEILVEQINEDRQQALKIYKENALIFGTDAKSSITLEAVDLHLFNLIYKITQDKVRQCKEPPKKHLTISIEQKIIVDYLWGTNTKNHNWKKYIEKSLLRLSNYKRILRDYIHPDLGHIKFFEMSLIALPKITKNNKDKSGRNDFIECVVPDLIVNSAWRKIKYTHLDLDKITLLKSKFSISLFEYISAIKQYKNSKNDFINELDISLAELQLIFSKQNVSSLSRLLQVTKFKSVVIPELQKLYPNLEYETFSKDKKITLYFQGKNYIDPLTNLE